MIKGWVWLCHESCLSSSKLFPSPLLCHGNHCTQFYFLEPGRLTAFQGDECQSLAPHIPVLSTWLLHIGWGRQLSENANSSSRSGYYDLMFQHQKEWFLTISIARNFRRRVYLICPMRIHSWVYIWPTLYWFLILGMGVLIIWMLNMKLNCNTLVECFLF